MRPQKVCVVGMGFVGLTLGAVLADRKFTVTGVEVNPQVAAQLARGEPHFHERGLDVLMRKHLGSHLFIRTDMPREPQDVFIISVGSPVDEASKKPILDHVISAARSIQPHLHDGTLVILRSTVPVGVTRAVVKPILDHSGKRYNLAFCPERTVEGKALEELRELPQVIGGLTQDCVDRAMDLFRAVTPATVEVSSLEVAEMIKIINNCYRDVNFAFANDMALVCEKIGLNAGEVIRAANFGYARSHIPVPGFVGGACLDKDPHILMDFSGAQGYMPRVVQSARRVNESLPEHVVERAASLLKQQGKDLATAKIFVSGWAFKGQPETDDIRQSPTLALLKDLRKRGAQHIQAHDFVVAADVLRHLKVEPVTLQQGFQDADLILIANNHKSYRDLDIGALLARTRKPAVFMDCWQLFDAELCRVPGITLGGLGVV